MSGQETTISSCTRLYSGDTFQSDAATGRSQHVHAYRVILSGPDVAGSALVEQHLRTLVPPGTPIGNGMLLKASSFSGRMENPQDRRVWVGQVIFAYDPQAASGGGFGSPWSRPGKFLNRRPVPREIYTDQDVNGQPILTWAKGRFDPAPALTVINVAFEYRVAALANTWDKISNDWYDCEACVNSNIVTLLGYQFDEGSLLLNSVNVDESNYGGDSYYNLVFSLELSRMPQRWKKRLLQADWNVLVDGKPVRARSPQTDKGVPYSTQVFLNEDGSMRPAASGPLWSDFDMTIAWPFPAFPGPE